MAMTDSGRATAIYNQIAAGPNFSKLSASEKSGLMTSLQNIWGTGDLTYITGNAQVNPGSTLVGNLATFISASPGSPCTGTGLLSGTGTIS
jgi:hypothetical protein